MGITNYKIVGKKHKCYSGSMQGSCAPFEGKNITLMGLGLLGRGVGDAEFLAGCGARVLITDKKTEGELADSVARLQKYPNIEFHLGGHRIQDFTSCDMVLKAAGVPLDSPEITAAKAAGVPVCMSTALFAEYAREAGATIVGITGTRGKSTVAHMIHHALCAAGKRSHLGGNIRGLSTLAMLPEIRKGDICVLELDSWQLQGFGDLQISPHVAVVTNLMPDHMNYYHGDMHRYFSDKANIFKNQKDGDTLIVCDCVLDKVAKAHPPIAPKTPPALPEEWQLKIIGEHNVKNARLAAAALRALLLAEQKIRSGIESFEPVEGRLQLVREVGGIKIYNDNNATTPEATIAALRALDDGKKNTILIMGGADKGLDMSELVKEAQRRCKGIVLLAGTGTDRINTQLGSDMIYHITENAVRAAFEQAGSGDVVLFSPAFASFGMFKNEYDRNDRFMDAVAALRVRSR